MNLESFNNLPIKEKVRIVFGAGVSFIGHRIYYNQKLCLYNCGEFFAEVWHDPQGTEITKIEGIPTSDKRVDRYIDFMRGSDPQPKGEIGFS